MNPLIGITIYSSAYEDSKMSENTWVNVVRPYVKCINQLGGTPIVIPIAKHYSMSTEIIEKLDGVIFTGDNRREACGDFVPNKLEIEFSKSIMDSDLPVLGIGRGLKLINHICGGTLKDFDTNTKNRTISYESRSKIDIVYDTKLLDIIGRDSIESFEVHVQYIKKLGRGLKINAIRKDKVIVGIESLDERFLIALEWNPELFMQLESIESTYSKEVFKCFVDKSLIYKTSKSSHNQSKGEI